MRFIGGTGNGLEGSSGESFPQAPRLEQLQRRCQTAEENTRLEGCLAASRVDGRTMVISVFLPITLFPKEKRLDESHLKAPLLSMFLF